MFFAPPRLLLVATVLFVAFAHTTADAAGRKRRDPSILLRFHAQVSGYDPSFAAKIRIGNPPKEVNVEKIPSISEHEIASFYPYKAADGSFSVVLKLDRHGETILEAVSTEKRGSLLVLLVNGRPVTSLLIDKIIRDGIIFIPSGLSLADIHAMGASFTIMGEQPDGRKNKAPTPTGPAANSDLPAR